MFRTISPQKTQAKNTDIRQYFKSPQCIYTGGLFFTYIKETFYFFLISYKKFSNSNFVSDFNNIICYSEITEIS